MQNVCDPRGKISTYPDHFRAFQQHSTEILKTSNYDQLTLRCVWLRKSWACSQNSAAEVNCISAGCRCICTGRSSTVSLSAHDKVGSESAQPITFTRYAKESLKTERKKRTIHLGTAPRAKHLPSPLQCHQVTLKLLPAKGTAADISQGLDSVIPVHPFQFRVFCAVTG